MLLVNLVFLAICGCTFATPFFDDLFPNLLCGKSPKITDYPWQVSLQADSRHVCGGTILNETFIVTAAYCTELLKGTDVELTVRAGTFCHDWKGKVIPVKSVSQHPNYKIGVYDYDIALVELSTPIIFSEVARPVALPKPGEELGNSTEVTITGWGEKHTFELNKRLKTQELVTLTAEECKEKVQNLSTINNSANIICAETVSSSANSCFGDIGGSLVVDGILWGVASWTIDCRLPSLPITYTNVSAVLDFIQGNVTKEM